jgi:hypothetical protein
MAVRLDFRRMEKPGNSKEECVVGSLSVGVGLVAKK